jgi:hypothetical protein
MLTLLAPSLADTTTTSPLQGCPGSVNGVLKAPWLSVATWNLVPRALIVTRLFGKKFVPVSVTVAPHGGFVSLAVNVVPPGYPADATLAPASTTEATTATAANS